MLPAEPPRTCRSCEYLLPEDLVVSGAPCPQCRTPLALIWAATLHLPPLAEAVHALKYEGGMELASLLARYLHAAAETDPWPGILARLDGIVPVPLHEERLAERGYNQSLLLADSFAKGTVIPVMGGALARVRSTQSQVGLQARDRVANVKEAFSAVPDFVLGKTLLLVDDVSTTGSTMSECAAALRAAGAGGVFGLTLSRPALGEEKPVQALHG